jgi:hypothetical protein
VQSSCACIPRFHALWAMGEFDGGCGLSDAFQAVHTAMHRSDDVEQPGETVRDFSDCNSLVCCRVWSVVYRTP